MRVQPLDTGSLGFELHFLETGERIAIDQPDGFNDFKISIVQRNYARELEITDSLKLSFVNEKGVLGSGFKELLEEYDRKSFQGCVDLIVLVDGTEWFAAELRFNKAETDNLEYIEMEAEIKNLRKDIERREDTKVDLLATENLDGNVISPVDLSDVLLRDKRILNSSRHSILDSNGEEWDVWRSNTVGTDETAFGLLNYRFYPFGGFGASEIDETLSYSFFRTDNNEEPASILSTAGGFDLTNAIGNTWRDNGLFNFKFERPSDFEMNIEGFNASFSNANNVVGSTLELRLGIIQWDSNFTNSINRRYETLLSQGFNNAINGSLQGDINFSDSFPAFTTLTIEVFYNRVSGVGDLSDFLEIDNVSIESFSASDFPNSTAKMVRLIDAGKKILENYTNGQAVIESPKFEVGEVFYDYFINNGYYIRGFNDREITINLKEWFGFIESAFNCDIQINGNNIFIGRHEDFYTDIEISRIEFRPDHDSYKCTSNDRRAYNEFKLKYKNYEDDDKSNTLDAFHTESEFFIPNDKIKKSNSKEITFTADHYAIEYARREGIDSEPTTAKIEDEDKYIVDTINLNGVLTNRSDEGFISVENIFSPNTSYNLRLSLKRLILDHWAYFLSECGQNLNNGNPQLDTVYARNTFFKANPDLKTQAGSGINTTISEVVENENIVNNLLPTPIITTSEYEFIIVKRFKYDELLNLFNGIINDKGYITFFEGETEIKLYSVNCEYDLYKEELKIKGEVKWI